MSERRVRRTEVTVEPSERTIASVGAEIAVAFGPWLHGMRRALRGEQDSDVPCGSCTACCSASQFVPIGPDEVDTLAHVPAELLVPAPGQPPGHVVMGYDDHGRCPMLRADGCSIYEHRPQACRTYDCRIYAATGVEPDDAGVAERVRRWTFEASSQDDGSSRRALLVAVEHVRDHDPAARDNPTRLAVRAVEAVHDVRR